VCLILACALALQHVPAASYAWAAAPVSPSAVRPRATRQTPQFLAALSQALTASRPADVAPTVAPQPIPFSRRWISSPAVAWFKRTALIFFVIDLSAPFLHASTVGPHADVLVSGAKALWPVLMIALPLAVWFAHPRRGSANLPSPEFREDQVQRAMDALGTALNNPLGTGTEFLLTPDMAVRALEIASAVLSTTKKQKGLKNVIPPLASLSGKRTHALLGQLTTILQTSSERLPVLLEPVCIVGSSHVTADDVLWLGQALPTALEGVERSRLVIVWQEQASPLFAPRDITGVMMRWGSR